MSSNIKDLNPYFLGAIFSVFALLLWYFSCLAIEQTLIPKYWQSIIQFISTLVATGIGAYIAFKYRIYEKNNEVTDKEVESLNNAIITLARQVSLTEGVERKIKGKSGIDEFKRNIRAALSQEQVLINSELKMPQGEVGFVNINTLTFLIKYKNDELIKKIVDCESYVNELLTAIDIHNYYCTNVITDILQKGEASVENLNSQVQGAEKKLLIQVAKTLKLLQDVLIEIQDISKALFPNAIFINFDKV